MDYTYTAKNALLYPQNYMYSEFNGSDFLTSFFSDREMAIKEACRVCKKSDRPNNSASNDLRLFLNGLAKEKTSWFDDSLKNHLRNKASFAPIDNYQIQDVAVDQQISCKKIDTKELLNAIIRKIVDNEVDTTFWPIEKLRQKFEVSKKVRSNYQQNLGKGEGTYDDLHLYWLFGAIMAIRYIQSDNLKYLNALCKINDIICSVPIGDVAASIPLNSFKTLLFIEVSAVKHIAQRIEVNIEL